MRDTLPQGMALLQVLEEVQDRTWSGLKDIMSKWVILRLHPESYVLMGAGIYWLRVMRSSGL